MLLSQENFMRAVNTLGQQIDYRNDLLQKSGSTAETVRLSANIRTQIQSLYQIADDQQKDILQTLRDLEKNSGPYH